MAMHNPVTWIVGGESEQEIAACREHCCITAGGVVEGKSGSAAIPDTGTFAYDIEVVAVEMDWVRKWDEGAGLDPPKIPLPSC